MSTYPPGGYRGTAPTPPPAGFRPGPIPPAAPWGYGYVPAPARPQVKRASHVRLLTVFVVGMLVFVGAFLIVAKIRTPAQENQQCPPTCPKPPIGAPVATGITYQGDGFSFSYPQEDRVYSAAKDVTGGRVISLKVGDGGSILLSGGAAGGATAEQYATSYVRSKFADAQRAYVIPNAFIGYTAGYGEVDDVYLQSTSGEYEHDRLIVLAAVKNGVAVLAVGLGLYHPWSQSFTNGHPSGAGAFVGRAMGQMVNSFRWKGDPAR